MLFRLLLTRLNRVISLTLATSMILSLSWARPAEANEKWRAAKRYSAAVAKAEWEVAKATLEAAKVLLTDAKDRLEAAKEALEQAETEGVSPEGMLKLIEAVAQASLAVTEATGTVIAARAALVTVAGVDFGTRLGETVDWWTTLCWDPVCDLDAVDPTYTAPTAQEIDDLIPPMLTLAELEGFALTRADFDHADAVIPGSGTAAWDFLHFGIKMYVIELKGAAAFSAGGLCPDVLVAADDLETCLNDYSLATNNFSRFLASSYLYYDNPRPAYNAARQAILDLEPFVDEFPDPVAIQAIIDEMIAALDDNDAAIDAVSDPMGNPRPLEGVWGILPSLTLSEFLEFLNNCEANGESCLPLYEVEIIEALNAAIEVNPPGGQNVGAELAAYLGDGDTGDEADLFGPSGELMPSEVLKSAVANRWGLIAVCESPLSIECGGEPCPDIPTVSEWGMIVMVMLTLTIATVILRRRRQAATRAIV